MVVFGQSGCVQAKLVFFKPKVVVFRKSACVGEKWLTSGKSGCIRAKCLYSDKVVLFEQK